MRLLLFNPETEYALASGASFYTPPKQVMKLRKDLQLLPEAWARPGDWILVDDKYGLNSEFDLVSWDMLSDLFSMNPDTVVEPWGWNHALIRKLKDCGVPDTSLPDDKKMDRIRKLAHRKTTVALNMSWNKLVRSDRVVDVPVELNTIEECMRFVAENPGCWMKAPWSSSGRGVINTAADMTEELVEQWCRGILRRQGSVMGETGADRIADFATEWIMVGGEARYLGLSSFSTSNRGKYISNDSISQDAMAKRFDALSMIPVEEVRTIQKIILQNILSGYDGPCGVDMLIERGGHLRPFVELNLRRTMGMLNLRFT
ncbi:MAG: hypothetical protein K2N25_09085 [Muribaculaceae bacterium]|nr:hypothetical protein [Muribaculaceae bacterium]